MRRFFPLVLVFGLSACAVVSEVNEPTPPESIVEEAAAPPPPPEDARSVDEFDTTSDAQRREAADVSDGGVLLGQDVVTLGDPAEPGFWVLTSMVDADVAGRVELVGGGGSVEVTLMPTAGSGRISLAALRILEVPLTDLVEVEIYESQ